MTERPKALHLVKVGKAFVTAAGVVDPWAGRNRLAGEAGRLDQIRAEASPPPEMRAAPMAPARGAMHLVPNFVVTPGGMRRVEGAHWQGMSPLAKAVAQARRRHEARRVEADFCPPFSPGQVVMAETYAALVEWREGSGLRCSGLEAGRNTGAGGSGLFIDGFIDKGDQLAELQRRIGDGVAMSVRRHMDRGNGRRSIRVREAVDMLVLGDVPVKAILRRFGWVANMRECGELRAAICGALDRMQGYGGGRAQDRA